MHNRENHRTFLCAARICLKPPFHRGHGNCSNVLFPLIHFKSLFTQVQLNILFIYHWNDWRFFGVVYSLCGFCEAKQFMKTNIQTEEIRTELVTMTSTYSTVKQRLTEFSCSEISCAYRWCTRIYVVVFFLEEGIQRREQKKFFFLENHTCASSLRLIVGSMTSTGHIDAGRNGNFLMRTLHATHFTQWLCVFATGAYANTCTAETLALQ